MRQALVFLVFAAVAAVAVQSRSDAEDSKKFTPRLPPYYAAIVTPSQRKQIYALQERYAEQTADLKSKLAELQSQLAELNHQRDAEIEAVLYPQQRRQLQAARDAAAAKRKKSQ